MKNEKCLKINSSAFSSSSSVDNSQEKRTEWTEDHSPASPLKTVKAVQLKQKQTDLCLVGRIKLFGSVFFLWFDQQYMLTYQSTQSIVCVMNSHFTEVYYKEIQKRGKATKSCMELYLQKCCTLQFE